MGRNSSRSSLPDSGANAAVDALALKLREAVSSSPTKKKGEKGLTKLFKMEEPPV